MQTNYEPTQPAPRDRWIDLRELEQLCCVKKSTIYAMLRDPQSGFPRPARFSARLVRWSESQVLRWMQDRLAASSSNVKQSPGVTRHILRG